MYTSVRQLFVSKRSVRLLGVVKNDLFSKGTGFPYRRKDGLDIIQPAFPEHAVSTACPMLLQKACIVSFPGEYIVPECDACFDSAGSLWWGSFYFFRSQ